MATQSDFRVKKGLIVGTTDVVNPESGTFTYDADFETVDLTLDANVRARLAQDHYFYVKAAATITKGDVVYASGAVGASGKIEATPYIANNTIDESLVLGVAAEDIATGNFGFVAQFGSIRGLDASGGLTTGGESWTDGAILYASPTYAGELTLTKPSAPNQDIPIAFVISNNASTGTISVRASRLGYHMDEVHDVEITSIADNDLLVYNNSNSRWENGKTIGDLTLTGELNGPATFYIDPSPHDPDTDGATNGLVVIRGDLQVDGTTTTINSTTVTVDDKNIILADGATNNTEASGGGITIAGASAQLTYDGVQDRWNMNKGLELLSVPLVVGTGSTDVGRIENSAGVFSMTAYTGRQIAFGNDDNGEHVRIDANGKVGIGTNDPFAQVHSEIDAASGAGAGTSGALWLKNKNQTDGNAATIFWGDDEAAAMGAINFMHDDYTNNYGSMRIDTRGTTGYSTKLTLSSDGYLGIGTDNPLSPLSVQGDGISIRLDGTANTSRKIFFRNTTNTNKAEIYADGGLKLWTEDPGTDITLVPAGNVIISDTTHVIIDDATEYSTTEASELNPVGTDALYLYNEEGTSTYGKVSILMRDTGSGGGAAGRITLKNNRSGGSAFAFFMRDNSHSAEQQEKMYLDSDGNLSLTGTGAVVITATPGTTPGNNSAIELGRADGSSNIQMNTALAVDVAIPGTAGVTVGSTNSNTPATRLRSANSANGNIVISPKGVEKIRITAAEGHMLPADTNQDLGSTTQPWQNIYTQDLNLSNEKRNEGNSVDGTKGNWTIQEGDAHLYIINNNSGKKYRFALEEIE